MPDIWDIGWLHEGQVTAGSDPGDRLWSMMAMAGIKHVWSALGVVDRAVGVRTERRLCLSTSVLWPVIALQASE